MNQKKPIDPFEAKQQENRQHETANIPWEPITDPKLIDEWLERTRYKV